MCHWLLPAVEAASTSEYDNVGGINLKPTRALCFCFVFIDYISFYQFSYFCI